MCLVAKKSRVTEKNVRDSGGCQTHSRHSHNGYIQASCLEEENGCADIRKFSYWQAKTPLTPYNGLTRPHVPCQTSPENDQNARKCVLRCWHYNQFERYILFQWWNDLRGTRQLHVHAQRIAWLQWPAPILKQRRVQSIWKTQSIRCLETENKRRSGNFKNISPRPFTFCPT